MQRRQDSSSFRCITRFNLPSLVRNFLKVLNFQEVYALKIKRYMKNFIITALLSILCAACQQNTPAGSLTPDLLTAPWEQIEQSAKGSTVRMMMWQGDPLINRYMSTWVVPEVKKRYDITLEVSPWEVGEIPKIFMAEIEANQQFSSLDIGWINGENFFQVRQLDALFGPFAKRLPNAQFIDFQNPFIGVDFQQPVDGYECPWGNVQECIIYDSIRTPQPPRTLAALETYVKTHPGKFTIPFAFTVSSFPINMGFLKAHFFKQIS